MTSLDQQRIVAVPEPAKASWVAQLLLALTVLCGLAAMALYPLIMATPLPGGWGVTGNPLADMVNAIQAALAVPLVAGLFGFVIVKRQTGNRIGWLLLLLGLAAAMSVLAGNWAIYAYYTVETPLLFVRSVGWITNWMWIFVYTILLLMIAIFPDGRFLSARWRGLILATLALFTVPLVVASTIETPMSSAFYIPSPFFANHPQRLYNALFSLGVPFMPITAVLVLVQLIIRFRRARGIERQQIKWLLAGMVLLVLMVLGGLYLTLILGNPLGDITVNLSVLAPLFGIGIALVRYRLYDIDLIIRRSLVYALLTATLLVIYFGSVILLQRLFGAMTGQQSTLAVVLSTLLIATLFNPLRRSIQRLIERRFYRRRYNAERVLERFALAARKNVDIDALEAELTAVVRETMLPDSVTVWLNRPRSR